LQTSEENHRNDHRAIWNRAQRCFCTSLNN
jgi:hypothetical protein